MKNVMSLKIFLLTRKGAEVAAAAGAGMQVNIVATASIANITDMKETKGMTEAKDMKGMKDMTDMAAAKAQATIAQVLKTAIKNPAEDPENTKIIT